MQITLISGRKIDSSAILFDGSNYHFSIEETGEDITNDIRRADKLTLVPGFDIERDLRRASVEKPASGGGRTATSQDLDPLDESTARIFGKQIVTDPFSAPLESANNLAQKFFSLPGLQKVLIVGALAAVLYIAVKKA